MTLELASERQFEAKGKYELLLDQEDANPGIGLDENAQFSLLAGYFDSLRGDAYQLGSTRSTKHCSNNFFSSNIED